MREPKQFKTAWQPILVLAIVSLIFHGRALAQNFVLPIESEKVLANVASVSSIETDMMDCPAWGGKLISAVYDSSGSSVIRIWHSSGIGGCFAITIPGASEASVSLADATSYTLGNRYWLVVTYTKANQIYVNRYLVSFPGSASFQYLARFTLQVSKPGKIARNARIDGLPDTSVLVYGLPAYTKFVASWIEGDSLFCGTALSKHSIPVSRVPVAKIKPGSNADVAGYTDYTTNRNYAIIAYKDVNGALNYTELDMSAINPVPSTPVLITADTNTDNTPCIEAMNLFDPALGGAKWQVAISKKDPVSGCWKAFSYNNMMSQGENCIDPVAVLGSSRKPVLAAGIGRLGGSFYIGNSSYMLGFKPEDTCNYYAQYVNSSTGRLTFVTANRSVWDTTYASHTVQLSDTTFIQDTLYVIDTTYVEVENSGSNSGNSGKGKSKGNGNGNGNNKGKGKAIGKIKKMNSNDSLIVYIDTVAINYIDTFSVSVRDSSYTTMSVQERVVVDTNRRFYQVNNEACGKGQRPLSVSTPENTGNGTLTVWHNGSSIKYKLIFNKAGFKPGEEDTDPDEQRQALYRISELTKANISVFPIPAQSHLNIDGAEGCSYTIIDLTGRILKTGAADSTIEVRSLHTGTYIIRFSKDGNDVQSVRFVKE